MQEVAYAPPSVPAPIDNEIPPFQLDKFLRNSRQLDLSGIPLEDAAKYPVSASEVRVIRYMQDTEYYTVHYMKALLDTAALADHEARAFLVVWGYEECYHGRALAGFLEATGHEPSKRSLEEFARPRRWLEVLQDWGSQLLSTISHDFLAVHMTWGAINELTAVHAYTRLAELTKNPILAEICRRIVKDERRHFAFYYQQARRRLQSGLGQRMARFSIKALWTPVGGSMAPPEDVDHVGAYLFDDEAGHARLHVIDETIAKLQGMEWFDMVAKATIAGTDRMKKAGLQVARP